VLLALATVTRTSGISQKSNEVSAKEILYPYCGATRNQVPREQNTRINVTTLEYGCRRREFIKDTNEAKNRTKDRIKAIRDVMICNWISMARVAGGDLAKMYPSRRITISDMFFVLASRNVESPFIECLGPLTSTQAPTWTVRSHSGVFNQQSQKPRSFSKSISLGDGEEVNDRKECTPRDINC